MRLLCLDALRRFTLPDEFEKKYATLLDEYVKTENAIRRASEILDSAGLQYAFFKSIRPYQEVTVDLDILVFGSAQREAVQTLESAHYSFLGGGPLSITLRDDGARINLDIYDEIGVSRIIYLDKDIFARFVEKRKLTDGFQVKSLSRGADLLSVIAHSVIKEQMYVLSEYYTTLHYLAHMKHEDLNSFCSLARDCRTRRAVQTHLAITAALHYQVHGQIPAGMSKLLNESNGSGLELARLVHTNFAMPHKFHPVTSARALIEKLGENKARRSFTQQAVGMLDPEFASSVFKRILHYVSRETY